MLCMIRGNMKLFRKFRVVWRNNEHLRFLKMWKKGYSPLNFDADDPFEAFNIAIKLYVRFKNVEYRKSSSGRGFHFRVLDDKGDVLYLPSKEVYEIRKEIGDDKGRLFWDSVKLRYKKWRPISVLFDSKNGKRASGWKKLDVIGIIEILKCSNLKI